MGEYIFSVIGAAFIASAVLLFLPEGNFGKYVKLAASLCVLAFMISPLADVFLSFDADSLADSLISDTEDGALAEDKYFEALAVLGRDELKSALYELICEKFNIAEENIKIDIEAGEKDGVFCVERVKVGLFGAAVLKDPEEIEEYVKKLVGRDCDIYY